MIEFFLAEASWYATNTCHTKWTVTKADQQLNRNTQVIIVKLCNKSDSKNEQESYNINNW